MRPPANSQWESPGFQSITVAYNQSTNRYFNLTLSILVMLALEFKDMRRTGLVYFCVVMVLVNNLLTLSLGGNYFIDNFGGMVGGIYLWLRSKQLLSYFVDVKIFGYTLHERHGHVPRKC